MAITQEDAIRKVQALWRLADDPGNTDEARESAANKARDFMARYQIDEIVLQEKEGKREQIVLKSFRITRDNRPAKVEHERIALAHQIAIHNRCRAVIQGKEATVDVATGKPIVGGTFLTYMGFESDTRMVEALYFALSMQMAESLLAENTSHMTEKQRGNYEREFATAYVDRIAERLRQIARKVDEYAAEGNGNSMALVLRDRKTEVEDSFTKMFPDLRKVKVSRSNYDPNARERGKNAADKADLGQTRVGEGGGTKKEVGRG